jgi:hypothetical protein
MPFRLPADCPVFILFSGIGPREAGERTQRKGFAKQDRANEEGRRLGVKMLLAVLTLSFAGQVLVLLFLFFLWHEILRFACKKMVDRPSNHYAKVADSAKKR